MDKQTETYYENLFELFGETGYKQLIGEIGDAIRTLKQDIAFGDFTNDQLREKRGELMALNRVFHYESMMRKTFESLQNTAVEDDNADL